MLSSNHVFYGFSKDLKPVLTVEPGEIITIETLDAFNNQINDATQKLDELDWNKVNPATGPIYVKTAEPGDFLKVTIEGIELNSTGVMASIPHAGVFGNIHKKSTIKMFNLEDEFTEFNDLVLPISPMIGVIGVAPENGMVPNGEPGGHGGNMDNRLITLGTELYLPVFHPGALFGLGDLHASMGDGEVNVTGIEVSGKVTLTFEVLKKIKHHNHPIFKKDGSFYCLYSADTLDEAVEGVSNEMLYWITEALQYDLSDSAMLLSLMADLEICQVVDPKKTVRMKMPNIYFRNLNL
ncbi:MAG: acetamidase/formamidase family protein [Clostridia bacterium]|nr:acetamidase/formamidase family protein [Clostridia bacterium]